MLDVLRDLAGDGYLYLATPYSKYPGGIELAYRDACRVAGWLIRNHVATFCPIAHSHPLAVFGGIDPKDHSVWMPLDRRFMAGARALVVCQMPGWDQSFGVGEEIREFQAAGKRVLYLPLPIPK